MLKVDVESGRVLFLAEGIPLQEPLLEDDEKLFDTKKKKSSLLGLCLVTVATLSTFAMVLFFALHPSHSDRARSHDNTTSFVFPFEVQGPLDWIDDASSPTSHVMKWMTDTDMKVETTSLMERLAVVTFFVATNGASKWSTSLGLMPHKTSICDWNDGEKGVFCDSDRQTVIKILLNNMNLEGSLPHELTYLSNLEKLDVANNRLVGNLPQGLSDMKWLSEVNLDGNLPAFASNVNDILCHEDGCEKKVYQVMTMGEEGCRSCLCCTDCPDGSDDGHN